MAFPGKWSGLASGISATAQAPPASPQNTAASLKIAKAEAQLSEASVGGGTPDTAGTLLNTYA
jgi:hypothetical protein